jgi:hypothetical protein
MFKKKILFSAPDKAVTPIPVYHKADLPKLREQYYLALPNFNKVLLNYFAFCRKTLFLFLENKSKKKEAFIIPCKEDMYIYFAWLVCLLIIPTLSLKIYTFNIDIKNLGKLFFLILLSCFDIYILLIAGLNLFYKNKYNI